MGKAVTALESSAFSSDKQDHNGQDHDQEVIVRARRGQEKLNVGRWRVVTPGTTLIQNGNASDKLLVFVQVWSVL